MDDQLDMTDEAQGLASLLDPAALSRRRALGLGAAAAGLAVGATVLPALPAMAAKKKTPPPTPLGVIQANRMNLAMTFFDGIVMSTLNLGVGHWPGTPLPGRPGNGVYPGHRVSHHRAFLNIDKMQVGDPIDFYVFQDKVTYRYLTTSAEVVDPKKDAARILQQTPASTVTLFACHPPHSTRFRYVVHALLQGPLS